MMLFKCDICKKVESGDGRVRVDVINKGFAHADVCLSCAKPLATFAKKNKLEKLEKELTTKI